MCGLVHRATVGVVLAVAMAIAGAAGAQAASSGVGPPATARYDHTATLLHDGRVLVAGGTNGAALESAQLYDPAANRWSNAAPMNFARHGHAAVLLRSGKVLVAGGLAPTADQGSRSSGGYTRSAEIYDPGANSWTKTGGNMSTARFQPTMTVLRDGRVLVAGGSGDIETPRGVSAAVSLRSAEIYDPATDSWTDAPSMSVPRWLHTATLLRSGAVLVAGGFDDASGELGSAELYDPAANVWSPAGSLAQARDSATATALPDGEILVAGGDGGPRGALASSEVYEPAARTWRAAANMAGARQTAAAALLKDGTVLVAGGEDRRLGTPLNTLEQYDPATDSWTDAGTMTDARKQHTVTALDDGRALVVGGNPGGFAGGLAGVERLSTVTTTLTAANFGSELIGTSSTVVKSVVTNTGSMPLVVTGVSVTGADVHDFAIASESCLASPIAPGATCQIGLQFTPTTAGARSATLALADNTAAGASTAALTGTGLQPPPVPDAGTGTIAGTGQTTASGSSDVTAGVGATSPGAATGGTRGTGQTGAVLTGARASCKVKTARRRARRRSTVTCQVTWPTGNAVALDARLMHGTAVLAGTRTTARGGHGGLRLRPALRLARGRYTVVIGPRDGSVVVRQAIRVA